MKYLIGIDEVGRGPIAGPVTLGLCLFLNPVAIRKGRFFAGVKESKQLTSNAREAWLEKMKIARNAGHIYFCTSSISASLIDRRGLSWAINTALARCLAKMERKMERSKNFPPDQCKVMLDGGLVAPARFVHQKTIIKGDEKETVIALASIVAKVTRDRFMCMLAKKSEYARYDFHIHKGYGTRAHYQALKLHGKSTMHRSSFFKKMESKI